MLSLTQGHLKLLDLCPRRYQYSYLEQVPVPTDPAVLERQQWGTEFHLVMQQRELGLPIAGFLREDAALAAAVNGLLAAAPELFAAQADSFRQSEHRRSAIVNGYRLVAIYDLLVLGPTQGQIIDWKTYQRPLQQAQLAKDWQTRLYLYLLVATSDLAPEQVTMAYWFVPPPGAEAPAAPPTSVTIPYTPAQHRRTEADLYGLTDRLTALLAAETDLPKVAEAEGYCMRCPFAVRCQRSGEGYGAAGEMGLPAIADIAEVPL